MEKRGRAMLGTLAMMGLILAVLGVIAGVRGGSELVSRALTDGWDMLVRFGPLMVVSFLAAGFATALVPAEWVRGTLGGESGVRGLAIAAGVGVITPAGPFVSMPIAIVMIRAGAAVGPVVAFLTGWSLLSLHRLVAWEIPILGWKFAVLRYAASLALPLVAGWLAGTLARTFPAWR